MSNLLVAAIDFGTTYSGYAFSLLHEYKKDPLKISTARWKAGSGGLVSLKTPTCVLFDSTGTFHSFGYEAEEKYSNLALDDEHHDWFYFSRFKMILYNKKACICRERLVIALEPEAASLFCMHLPVQKDSVNSTFGVFKSGQKYMVVDAGGGTVDITVHEVRDNGSVKELHKANGGDWGGTKVDASFKGLLVDIVGKDVMETFISKNKYDFLHLMRDFEVKKSTINPELNDRVTFTIPVSLSETFSEKNPGSIITDAALNSKYKNQLTWKKDKLRIEAKLARTLFDESCKHIVDHLKELFMHPSVKDVSSILLVGGFAESPMLQSVVREAFINENVIIPKEAGLAVLKGAVICGHEPEKISGRVCRYTYGVKVNTQFDSTMHPKFKKILHNNIEYCDDIFSIHVRVGQIVEVGEPQVKQTYYVSEPDQTSIDFKIYTSNNKEPTYTTDAGCTYLGTLTIDMPDTSKGTNRGAIVHMTFSGTEIAVTAVDKDDPERAVTTKVDFLG